MNTRFSNIAVYEQVPLLNCVGDNESALAKAIESHEADLIT